MTAAPASTAYLVVMAGSLCRGSQASACWHHRANTRWAIGDTLLLCPAKCHPGYHVLAVMSHAWSSTGLVWVLNDDVHPCSK